MADRDILPGNFKPEHYDLSIFNIQFNDWTYSGQVNIHGALVESTTTLTLNALELKLTSATFSASTGKAATSEPTTEFSYDKAKQRVTATFANALSVSEKAVLTINFTGIINNEMAGFYRSKYKPPEGVTPAASVPRDEEFHYMTSTQFEACDARRAFPCLDEPNRKATFDLSLEVPADQVALSNMPVKHTEPSSDRAGWTVVTFDRTPVMSTYLLAWAFGDFEYVEAFTERKYEAQGGKQLPVRVYTTRGLKEQGRWALQHAPKIIDYFSEIFDQDYPLPKSDLLAVHEFTHGAMENWGLVTYRTTAVLFDEATSEARYRNRVAYVVAHELAHQWFGNLVTMDWWDELWLNEGFATWVGWLATDHLHPEWQVWAQFVDEGIESAFKLDAVRASHPIQVPVRDALDVNQIFDHISYLKGCAVIRMLASHLGVPTFLKGVSTYLKRHAYGNAKTDALWQALSEASGVDVNALMHPWISKMGFPVLSVTEDAGAKAITVRQSRFLSTGDVKPEDDDNTWWVPLALEAAKASGGPGGNKALALTTKDATIGNVDLDFYTLNSGAPGFYRVNYPRERLAKLGTQLDRLSVEDRIAIPSGALALAYSGDSTTPALLELAKGFGNEKDGIVWSGILGSVGSVKSVFADDPVIKKGMENYTLQLIGQAVANIGWDFKPGEDYLTGQLRKKLLYAAVVNGHADILTEALSRFESYFSPTPPALHPNLRAPIFRAGISNLGKRALSLLRDEYVRAPSIDTREVVLSVLGHAPDLSAVKGDLFPFLFDPDPARGVAPGDMHTLAASLAASGAQARDALWTELKALWRGQVDTKLANPVVLDRFVKTVLGRHADPDVLADIDHFFTLGEGKGDTRAFARTLDSVREQIRARAAYRQREAPVVKAWLINNGYATGEEGGETLPPPPPGPPPVSQ